MARLLIPLRTLLPDRAADALMRRSLGIPKRLDR
jgi:hypothetical protein